MSYKIAYKSTLEHFFEQGEVTLFWKGRVALYAILKALNVQKGDEVILPAFTCVVVPNAIIYLGAKPVYADIDPNTYNIDPQKVTPLITQKTKVIIAQNTFGLSAPIDELKTIAEHYNLKIIEDCTHGFGGSYKGQKNGTLTDAAFFSTQWNKPYSTGIGGFALINDKSLQVEFSKVCSDLIQPTFKEEKMMQALLLASKVFLKPAIYWPVVNSYRFLSEKGLVVGSSNAEELEGPILPQHFFKGFTETQSKVGLKNLKMAEAENTHRMALAKLYQQGLADLGVQPVFEPTYATHTFLKYPLLVNNRSEFLKKASKAKIEIGEWFASPIHPITTNWELWQYQKGNCPIAEKISAHMVNLPTGFRTTKDTVSSILDFLKNNRNLLKI